MKFPIKRIFRIFCIWKITEFMPYYLRGAVFFETPCIIIYTVQGQTATKVW